MKVNVILQYEGKNYEYTDKLEYENYEHAEFMYTDGNWGCDCNRSIFINDHVDDEFPIMVCGDKIKLVELVEMKEEQK